MPRSQYKKTVYLYLCLIMLTGSHLFGQSIRNSAVAVRFDPSSGQLSAQKVDGAVIFSGGVHAACTDGELYLSESRNYRYTVERTSRQGHDPELRITGRDRKRRLDFLTRITLPAACPSIQIEVVYKNVSGKDIPLGSVLPLRLLHTQKGTLRFARARQCLTNGAMYYDAGMIQDFDQPWIKPEPYGETKGGVPLDRALNNNPDTIQSWWNIALFNGYSTESMAIGYLHNKNSLGRIQILKNDEEQLSLLVESVYNPGFLLRRSQEISSDKFAIVLGEEPYAALESYADLMAGEIKKPVTQVVNGWCNWFYTMDVFDEEEIVHNAQAAAAQLKPYGLEYIQIDEGFQTWHGEWQGNQRFPHGLKGLCDSIKSCGLAPGIWIAPFVISENTRLHTQHPECLLKDANGQPVRIGPWPSENTDWYRNEVPKRYALDITHPVAEQWFRDLIETIVHDWGFEMIKIDFVAWTLFSADRFHDPGVTPAQAYRKALSIVRSIAGEKCHILDCGPGNISAGFINSMRIEYDQNYGTEAAWTQYFIGSSCSAGAAGKRYFYHDKLWTNDIDHLCIDLLSPTRAQAAATLIGLSGGNVMSGDRLMNLDAAKLEILKKILPASIEQARPVDLYDADPQTIFSCKIKREFGEWDVVAFFNPDPEKSITRNLDLGRMWLDTSKTFLCFDFWNETFTGEVNQTIKATVGPASVTLFALHEKRPYPQILSTNRHVKQGAIELVDAHFDSSTRILYGTSVSPQGSGHSIFVHIPDTFDWQPRASKIYEYNGPYTIRRVQDEILRVDVTFAGSDTLNWKIHFSKKH